MLDCVAASVTATDGGSLEAMTAISGDSLQIQTGRGNCHIKGVCWMGSKIQEGEMSSVDQNMQPNAIRFPPHTTLSGDGIGVEILPSLPVAPVTTLTLKARNTA